VSWQQVIDNDSRRFVSVAQMMAQLGNKLDFVFDLVI